LSYLRHPAGPAFARPAGGVPAGEWCNGNTAVFGTVILGSSPSSPARPFQALGRTKEPSKTTESASRLLISGANMRVMKYVHRRSGRNLLRRHADPRAGAARPGCWAQKWVSLRTKDTAAVLRLAPPLILDLQGQIERATSGRAKFVPPTPIHPDGAWGLRASEAPPGVRWSCAASAPWPHANGNFDPTKRT
jgi:hypothetical protein